MDDSKAGRLVSTVRRHLQLRQVDVGELAGVDQKVVSLIERGLLARVSVEKFRRVCAVLEIEPVLDLRWRGGLGDRLIDRGHAELVELASILRDGGWTVIPEYSFSVYGERGSVDILAWHPDGRVLLIVEVKTRVTDLLSDTRTNRSMVAAHRSIFDSSFPGRTAETRRWLAMPGGDDAGLMFPSPPRGTRADAVHSSRVRRATAHKGPWEQLRLIEEPAGQRGRRVRTSCA